MLNVGDLVYYVDLGKEYDPAYHSLCLVTDGPFTSKKGDKIYVGIKSMDTGYFRWCNSRDLAVFSKSPSQEEGITT